MKFVIVNKQGLTDQQVNVVSKAFYSPEFGEVLETVDIDTLKDLIKVPPRTIQISCNKYLTEILIKTITPAYLRGTQIIINGIAFPVCKSNPQYFYQWQDRVPARLPEHLKQAYYNFNLRGDLYKELTEWNKTRIQKATECSKFKWTFAEDFYKQLYKTFAPQGIRVQSPNAKTFYESSAELEFEKVVRPEPELTAEEQMYLDIAELKHYTKAFGLQDTFVRVGSHHRTTPNGSTEEPILVSAYDIDQAQTSLSFNHHNHRELESFEDDNGFKVLMWTSSSSSLVNLHYKERENIETLKWFLSQPKSIQEEFLLPGWHFCPVCGELYYELDGCYDLQGNCHVPPIDFVPYNDETHDNEEDYD